MSHNEHLLHYKNFNYRLFVAIIFTLLIPTLYNTFRIYLIGNIPDVWGFTIASQIAWLNLIYEILQEGIILPLFFVLGPLVSRPQLFRQKILYGLAVIIPLYSMIAVLIWIFAQPLVYFLSQSPELVIETIHYIRLETIAIPLRVVTDVALIALITLSAKRQIYLYLLLQLLVRIISDYVFINEAALGWGVIGVAYSTIVIYLITALGGLLILFQTLGEARASRSRSSQNVPWRKWLRVSVLSGTESGVRNLAFIIMILKLVNEIGEQGTLWVTNAFIWGWLLLPILALGTLIKQDASSNGGVIGSRFKTYFLLSFIICFFWILTMPLWGVFIRNVMGIDEYRPIVFLTVLFLPFYVAFAVNNVLDSYLYAMGRTDLMLYQSLIVNIFYYGGAFILYLAEVFVPSLTSIALLFGFGLVLDLIVTTWLFRLAGYPRHE